MPCPNCGLRHPSGLGTVSSSQINSLVTTGAESTVSILASLHAVIGGVAFAGPVGAAIAGVIAVASLLISAFGVGSGCGQTCIIASNDANKVEALLQQNLQAYLSSPVHYKSLQTAALNNFDTIWQMLVTACSDPSLGDAGKRCISDRQSGSCKYHTSPGGWQNGKYVYPGANNSGTACWDWFIGYRSPIADDPTVVADPAPGSAPSSATGGSTTGAAATTGALSSGTLPLLLIAGGALILWGVMS